MNGLFVISKDLNFTPPDFENALRYKYPNRNEKYYDILLVALKKLTQPNAKVSITANALIAESNTSRPTWYSYFNSVEQYYSNVIRILGDIILDHSRSEFQLKASSHNWSSVLWNQRIVIFLSNTRSLADYFPGLKPLWMEIYTNALNIHVDVLASLTELSKRRARLLLSSLINESILHPEKYFTHMDIFQKYANRLYILFFNEQNS